MSKGTITGNWSNVVRLQTQSPHVDSLGFGGTKILLGGKTDWRQSKLVVQLVRGSRIQGLRFTVHGFEFRGGRPIGCSPNLSFHWSRVQGFRVYGSQFRV